MEAETSCDAKCPLVIISWEDSIQASGGWQFLSDFEPLKPMSVTSVGWLIQDGADCKVLAQSLAHVDGESVQSAGRKVIPTRCVLSIEHLEEKAAAG